MKQIAVSKFKATCLAVLADVRRTGKPIRVTRFGKPLVDVVPPAESAQQPRQLGAMKGTIRIVGDIISPAVDENDWEVLAE